MCRVGGGGMGVSVYLWSVCRSQRANSENIEVSFIRVLIILWLIQDTL